MKWLAILFFIPSLAFAAPYPVTCAADGAHGLTFPSGTNQFSCTAITGSGGVTWPATGDLVVSNSTASPAGLAPVNGQCAIGSGGIWAVGSCGGSSTITLGTTAAATNPQVSGDATTGLYSSATSTVSIAAGGSQQVSIGTQGVIIGSPTGSYQGTGTLNATGLDVNGAAVLTGNQTITLSGNVTGSGTTAITTTIGVAQVTNAMLAGSIAASKLVGTDIATVGTITSGTWQGTVIGTQWGGLGANESSATGVVQMSSGTTSISTALTNGSTATTQATNDSSNDIATDNFVQNQIAAQVDMHAPVQAATTAALILSPTYSNGSSGVGATLTATVVGALVLDGYTPNVGDRLLIKNQAAPLQNGCYTQTTAGVAGLVDYVLTRCTDFNQVANIDYGDTFPVLQGTVNVNQQFTMNNSAFTSVGGGTSASQITFAQTSGGSQLTGGNNITITGNSIAVNIPLTTATVLGTSTSATSPQISGDLTSGLYTPASSTVAISVGGTQAFVANTTGIAIGTSTPLSGVGLTVPTGVTVTAAGGTPSGAFTNSCFTPIVNTADTTDSLTGNGAVQYFSMNSGAATIPSSTIVSGKRFTITYIVDDTCGATSSQTSLTPVLCTASNCGSGTVSKMTSALGPSTICGVNGTQGQMAKIHCVGTASASNNATIMCAAESTPFGLVRNTQSSLVTGVVTNGTLYVNLGYNQATDAGNKMGMLGAWCDWDN